MSEVKNESRRGNYFKDLLVGVASFKFTRNIEGLGSGTGNCPDSGVPMGNRNSHDRVTTKENEMREFAEALRKKANSHVDGSVAAVLNTIADILDELANVHEPVTESKDKGE